MKDLCDFFFQTHCDLVGLELGHHFSYYFRIDLPSLVNAGTRSNKFTPVKMSARNS